MLPSRDSLTLHTVASVMTLCNYSFIHKESVTEIIIISQSYPTYALQLTGTSTVRKLDQTLCWWSGPQPWEGRAPLTTASVVASAVMALVGMNKVKKQSLSHVNRSQHRAGDGGGGSAKNNPCGVSVENPGFRCPEYGELTILTWCSKSIDTRF